MSRVQEIIKRRRKRKRRLEAALESIKSQLINFGALKIILFGSLNNGTIDSYSDLDLLVVMPSYKSGKEWMDFIYTNINRDIASDILVYNEKEFNRNLVSNSFLIEINNTGKVIYEA
ncbi:MAG: nucleotidyltransferase family protein [Promethearchaeati archaeon]